MMPAVHAGPLHIRAVLLPDDVERDVYIVGDRLTFEPVADATTVARAGFAIPGLVDAHCHIGIRPGAVAAQRVEEVKAQALVNRDAGVLTIRDAGSPLAYDELDDDQDMPRLTRAGRHLSAPRRYLPGLAIETPPDELPERVVEQARLGTGWVKLVADWIDRDTGDLGPTFDSAALVAAIEAAHRAGVRVAAHTFGEEAAAALVAAGVDSIEHGCGLDPGLLDRMAAQGTALVPTMINVDRQFEEIADQAEARFPAYAAHMRRLRLRFPGVVRAAHEAGVTVYVGSDAGGAVGHGLAADEVALLHEAGLPAVDALAAGSWRARRWLRWPGLDEGGMADFVVYDTNPCDDLAVLRFPRRIVLRGAVVV